MMQKRICVITDASFIKLCNYFSSHDMFSVNQFFRKLVADTLAKTELQYREGKSENECKK